MLASFQLPFALEGGFEVAILIWDQLGFAMFFGREHNLLDEKQLHLLTSDKHPFPRYSNYLQQWFSNFLYRDPLFRKALVLGPTGSDGRK